jgi:hypothetical protein
MNEESRPARRLPKTNITEADCNKRQGRRESQAEREHRFDRELTAAYHRRRRAAAGLGYQFKPPRKAAA